MKTIETTVYTYDELTSETAKARARDWFSEGVFDNDWWMAIYEDAKTVGLKITSFDLDSNRHAKGKFIDGAIECANAILANHGEHCETYKTAESFLRERDEIVNTAEKDDNGDLVSEYDLDEKLDEVESEFLKSILEDYSIMLQNESEHMTSREYLEEGIRANEYTFTEDGKRMG